MFGKKPTKVEITISNKTIVRVIAFLFGTVVFFKFIENVVQPLTYIFVSFFFALALNPAVN